MSGHSRLASIALFCVLAFLPTACGDSGGTPSTNNTSSNNGGNNGAQCSSSQLECDGTCVDQSVDNCGSCGNTCTGGANATAVCSSAGSCELECDSGFADADGDAANGCEQSTSGCQETNGGVELCDGKDNDCDDEVDEDFVVDGKTVGDDCSAGEGVCMSTNQYACSSDKTALVCQATPSSPTEEPEATCDGKDNDCDGEVDEGCDDDGDGWCDADMNHASGANCQYSVDDGADCDDDPNTGGDAVNPDEAEICDGKDNDCDDDVDEGCDDDGDGWCDADMEATSEATCGYNSANGADCDDDPSAGGDAVHPGAPGLCDGYDNDCNGTVDDIRRGDPPAAQGFQLGKDISSGGSIMAAPAGDSFCVVSSDADGLEFKLLSNDGSYQDADYFLAAEWAGARILDIDWDGTSCAVLANHYEPVSSCAPYTDCDALYLHRWEPGKSVVSKPVDATGTEHGSPNTGRSVALHHYSGDSFLTTSGWVVAYYIYRGITPTPHGLVYRAITSEFAAADSFSDEHSIDGDTEVIGNVEIGPSPNPNDQWAVVWYDGQSDQWSFRAKPAAGDLRTARASLAIADTGPDYANPVLTKLDPSDDTAYLSLRNTADSKIEVREWNSSYSQVRQLEFASSSSPDYWAPSPFAAPLTDAGWSTTDNSGPLTVIKDHSPLGWYMDPYREQMHRLTSSTDNINPTGPAALSLVAFDNKNYASGDQYLSTMSLPAQHSLQVMRLTAPDPATVEIDEFTCY